MPRNTDTFVLYHSTTSETGPRLAQYLGCPSGTDLSRHQARQYDTIIRWGSRTHIPRTPARIVQPKQAIANASDKFGALQTLADTDGVRVPNFTQDRAEIQNPAVCNNPAEQVTWPVLGRDQSHAGGTDIELLMQYRDAYLVSGKHHYVDYLPTEHEFRMHVVDGEVIKVHQKLLRREADMYPGYIRNEDNGWVFLNPREPTPPEELALNTADALGLDIAALDVIREEGTGDHYVLEVNSAPGLDEPNMRRYGDALADIAGIEEVAGNDAVDWETEPDTE